MRVLCVFIFVCACVRVRARMLLVLCLVLGRGPLQVTENDNPFHTRGASDYISVREYEVR